MVKIEIEESEYNELSKKAGEVENYKQAVQEERSKRKSAEKEVTDLNIQLDDATAEVKRLEKKVEWNWGKKSEELEKAKADLQELQTKLETAEAKAAKYDEGLTNAINEKLEKIPEEKRDFVKSVLGDKPFEDQSTLLDGFIEDYSSPNFKAKPKDWEEDVKDTSEYDKAKEAGDVAWMLNHAQEFKEE